MMRKVVEQLKEAVVWIESAIKIYTVLTNENKFDSILRDEQQKKLTGLCSIQKQLKNFIENLNL